MTERNSLAADWWRLLFMLACASGLALAALAPDCRQIYMPFERAGADGQQRH